MKDQPNSDRTVARSLRAAYRAMYARAGHREWWPAESRFEVCVGAILTQNTSWINVEKTIRGIKEVVPLKPKVLYALPEDRLASLLRPAGYFNVKARRLRSFLRVLVEDYHGNLSRLFAGTTREARERLLAIHGIGRETADSMLLYAGGRLSFVIDAYTERIFRRHGWWHADLKTSRPAARYESLKALCERWLSHVPADQRLDYWQDYHAQLVMIGKDYCRPKTPRCEVCPLKGLLPVPLDSTGEARPQTA